MIEVIITSLRHLQLGVHRRCWPSVQYKVPISDACDRVEIMSVNLRSHMKIVGLHTSLCLLDAHGAGGLLQRAGDGGWQAAHASPYIYVHACMDKELGVHACARSRLQVGRFPVPWRDGSYKNSIVMLLIENPLPYRHSCDDVIPSRPISTRVHVLPRLCGDERLPHRASWAHIPWWVQPV